MNTITISSGKIKELFIRQKELIQLLSSRIISLKTALFFVLLSCILYILALLLNQKGIWRSYPLWLSVPLTFYWIYRSGLNHFYKIKDTPVIPVIKKQTQDQAKKNNNTFSKDNPTYKKLVSLMTKKKLYKNADISLDIIAERLGISPGYLSQVINKVTYKNFSEYINDYRIEEVKRMLLDSEFSRYTILSIGYEAGFNSKSVFYTVFKKQTGLTPKQFKDQNI
ncbi:AraC family transcriptional regulator [Aquimarina sp. 2201CG5-10]|uniref:helix-turn-helix domain-containing protein n=1 Tax=Aquimarina callyspongiae TaxID=3098150 RepID=UPI002AB3472B|nr:AraC family transcriptional regulator [Aquimarina sp. 2201CG5-10]MDY8137078.1 AraC family transcriptional regulator [Aquimarina sp. 2201CG5-10]